MFQTVKSSFRSNGSIMDSLRQCTLHTNTCNYKGILLLKLSQIKFCNTAGYLRRDQDPYWTKPKAFSLICAYLMNSNSQIFTYHLWEKRTHPVKTSLKDMIKFFGGIPVKKKNTYSISGTVISPWPYYKIECLQLTQGAVLLDSAQLQLAGLRGALQDEHSQTNR